MITSATLLENIEQEEQEHPDDVDEVPIERSRRQSEEAALGVRSARRLPPENAEVDQPDEDVEAVQAGQGEKGRAEDRACPRGVLFVEEQRILVYLTAQEPRAEEEREP